MAAAAPVPVRETPIDQLLADVREVTLADVLGLFSGRAGSTTVIHRSSESATEIYVRDGHVDWVLSNASSRLLTGDVLAQMGAVAPKVVESAFIEQQADDPFDRSPIGSYLVRGRHVKDEDISAALVIQVAETTLRALLATDGEIEVRATSARLPFRARLPIGALVAEAALRGESFRQFNPFAMPTIDPQQLPATMRNAAKAAASIRDLAGALGRPEWALAQALEARYGRLTWRAPGERSERPAMDARGLIAALRTSRAELERERTKETVLRVATRVAFVLQRLERFYMTGGLQVVSRPGIVREALERVLTDRRRERRYPVERLIRIRPEGGLDLSLVNALLPLLPETSRRTDIERAVAEALSEVLAHVFLTCTKQVLSALDRRNAESEFESLRDWLLERPA